MIEVTLSELEIMASNSVGSSVERIVMHWSAGHHDQPFSDYDVQVTGDGTILAPNLTLEDVETHCWHRNSTSAGLSALCCVGATSEDLGDEPPTNAQIHGMAKALAALTKGFDWEINRFTCPTHGEVALIDGYGPGSGDPETRWDLLILRTGDKWWTGGEAIRILAREYRAAMEKGEQEIPMSVETAIELAANLV